MLTDAEVQRLKKVLDEYKSVSAELGLLRNSEVYKKKYKPLSKEEKEEVKVLLSQEKDLVQKKDLLVEERRSLEKKRDGRHYGEGSPGKNWYPEPGYGPSW